MNALPEVSILGHTLHAVSTSRAVDYILGSLDEGRGGWVMTPNLDILRRLVRDESFERLTRDVTLRLADGMPLVWASRLRRTPLPERVAGSDLIWPLCERGARANRSVYLLGGNPGAAESAARELARGFPSLRVAGHECPPMGFEQDEGYIAAMRDRLRRAKPDIVFVALGSPKQERVIASVRGDLPSSWFLGVGVSFSFVCGEIRRAPAWMRGVGLEWAHRLAQEPRRLARRYLIDGLPFAGRLLLVAALEGARAGRSDTEPVPTSRRVATPVGAEQSERAVPPSEAA